MRWREESGDYSPSAWLAGGFGGVTVAALAISLYPWIGMLPMLILSVAFGIVTVLCFGASARQHFINVGENRERARTSAAETPILSAPQAREEPTQAQSPPASVTRAPDPAPPRHFVNLSPSDLTGLYTSHTTLQADMLATPYIGKWMELSGTIYDITEDGITFRLQGFLLLARFDEGQRDQVTVLQRGESVRVIGQIESVVSWCVVLKHSELKPLNDRSL